MNVIEKIVYDALKTTPWLKNFVRNIYQGCFDLLPQRKDYFISPPDFRENFFFGFHDLSPFSLDQSKVLANELSYDDLRMPAMHEKINIGYFDFCSEKLQGFQKVGESAAWNFHKGCRLQWLGTNEVIFNTYEDERLVSKIINVGSNEERIINFPIDTVSLDGKYATSFSYERLEYLMPGYGYPYVDGGLTNERAPEETGVFLVD